MLTMALPSVVGFSAVIAGAVVALISVFIVKKPKVPETYDCEREIRRITMKVRHPWKARLARWTGVE